MSAPVFLWPVVSLSGGTYRPTPHTVAVFFESTDAEDFAMANNLYVGEPRYDRRNDGYRPVRKPSGYREWLASLEPKELPDGRFQVAA